MNKVIYGLSGLLVVQVALAVGLNVNSRGFAGERAREKLVSVPADRVAALSITDGKGQVVRLAKKDKAWVLPDEGDFPADDGKVKHFLANLAKAEEGAPVATSDGAAKRFKVAKAAFARKLVLGPGKKPLETIYIGKSQGVRQVYVRRAGQQGVRLMDFQVYEASTNGNDWIDTGVLKVKGPDIRSLSWGQVTLTRAVPAKAGGAKADGAKAAGAKPADAAQPGWQMQIGGQPAKTLPAASVQGLLDQLGSLWILGTMPQKPSAAPAGATEALDLKLGLDGGKSREYRIYKVKDGYDVAASNLPRMVKLSDTSAKGLIKVTGDKAFAPEAAASATSAPSAAPSATPPATPAPAATGGG